MMGIFIQWHSPFGKPPVIKRMGATLPLWRPAGNVDPLSQTSKLKYFGRYVFLTSNHTMAEESQPAKRHKPTISPNDTQPEEYKPIGAQISTQFAIPMGEEAKVDAAPPNEAFLESDARKQLRTVYFTLPGLYPNFAPAMTSGVIMGTAEKSKFHSNEYTPINTFARH
jgi:hypothetical protein